MLTLMRSGRPKLPVPHAPLPARLVEHPGADRDEQAALLGERDEVEGGTTPRSGCASARSASTATISSVPRGHHRLVLEEELLARRAPGAAPRRAPGGRRARRSCRGGRTASGRRPRRTRGACAASALLQQLRGGHAVAGVDGDAQAESQEELVADPAGPATAPNNHARRRPPPTVRPRRAEAPRTRRRRGTRACPRRARRPGGGGRVPREAGPSLRPKSGSRASNRSTWKTATAKARRLRCACFSAWPVRSATATDRRGRSPGRGATG